MTQGLLDTSIFIASEQGRELGALPERSAISVITLAELQIGVLLAENREERATRARTVERIRAADPIPVTEAVAGTFARLTATARRKGRKLGVLDTLIAATALEHGLPLYSQDRDFESFADLDEGLEVVLV